MASLSPSNPCVQAFITQALQAYPTSARGHAVFEEFDSATYHLEHSWEHPDVCTLMLVIGSPAPPEAATSIADDPQLHGVATALQAVPGFQLAVKASMCMCKLLSPDGPIKHLRAPVLFSSPDLVSLHQVSLPRLQKLGKEHQPEAIRALSCLRLALIGHSLRSALQSKQTLSCKAAVTGFPGVHAQGNAQADLRH